MIDWNLPLETDEPTPRPAVLNMIASGNYLVDVGSRTFAYPVLGFNKSGNMDGPPLRNVAQPTLRTSDECLQRMEALVRRMAEENNSFYSVEAAAIVEMLPTPPVDPDLIEARKISESVWRAQSDRLSPLNEKRAVALGDGTSDHSPMVTATLAALKRGRELAAQ